MERHCFYHRFWARLLPLIGWLLANMLESRLLIGWAKVWFGSGDQTVARRHILTPSFCPSPLVSFQLTPPVQQIIGENKLGLGNSRVTYVYHMLHLHSHLSFCTEHSSMKYPSLLFFRKDGSNPKGREKRRAWQQTGWWWKKTEEEGCHARWWVRLSWNHFDPSFSFQVRGWRNL